MLILFSTIISCVSISVFAALVCVSVSITSSVVGIEISAITAEIKNYKTIMKKKKKKHYKTVLFGKDKLNIIEILISKPTHSNDEFVSVNKILRKYNMMKEKIQNPESSVEYNLWK